MPAGNRHFCNQHKDGLTYEQFESLIIRKERALQQVTPPPPFLPLAHYM